MKNCINCGNECADEVVFCPNCGKKRDVKMQAQTVISLPSQQQYAPQMLSGTSRQKKKMSRGTKIAVMILSAFFVFVMGTTFISMIGDINKGKLYEAEFAQSVLTEGNTKPKLEYIGQNKLVLCEVGKNRFFWHFDGIVPLAYRSEEVEDVGGIVVRDMSKQVIAMYSNNAKVSAAIYTLKIIDPYNGVIVGTEIFMTDKEPPETIYGDDGYVMYPSDKEMEQWIFDVWSEYCRSNK